MKHQKTAKYVDIVKIMLYNVAKGGIMDKQKKTPSKKLSRTLLIAGIIGAIIGFPIWMVADSFVISTIGMFLLGISIASIFAGLTPLLAKLNAKLHTETMDYAGKEISEASVKTVEVATPAIRKTGEAMAPAVAEIVKEVKKADGTVKEDTEKPDKFCPYCGEGLDDEFKFCPKCGKEL